MNLSIFKVPAAYRVRVSNGQMTLAVVTYFLFAGVRWGLVASLVPGTPENPGGIDLFFFSMTVVSFNLFIIAQVGKLRPVLMYIALTVSAGSDLATLVMWVIIDDLSILSHSTMIREIFMTALLYVYASNFEYKRWKQVVDATEARESS